MKRLTRVTAGLALLLLSSAVLVAVGSVTHPAAAANDAGSGFQALNLRATSGGQQFFADKLAATAPGSAAGGIPWATADLGRSSSHALASVAWPGALAGNAGSLLLLLGGSPCVPGDDPVTHTPIPVVGGFCDEAAPVPQPVMDQYHYLNTPVRAEAQYPTNPSASQTVPGASMEAAATSTSAMSAAMVGGGYASDVVSFGTSRSLSQLEITGPRTATSVGSSFLKDVSLSGGVLTIDSVASRAVVTTTGDRATASGGTTISGLKVGGIPISVDGSGIHANGNNVPADTAVQAVRSILANVGIQLYVTTPSKQITGGSGTYRTGSLVVVMDVDQAGAKDDVLIVFGGAEATAAATLPYLVRFQVPPYQGGAVPGTLPPTGTGQQGASFEPGATGSIGQPPSVVSQPSGPSRVIVSLAGLKLSPGLSAAALVALAGLFVGLGLLAGRLPGLILAAPLVARCEEQEPNHA
jgi:hypothetical protein